MKHTAAIFKTYRAYFQKTNRRFFPERVIVELTNNCNFSCVMCPRQYMRDSVGFMEFSLFKKIIDELARYPKTIITPFFRGESLTHPQVIAFMRYIRKKTNARVLLATNAASLTPSVSRVLLKCNIDFISFSVDTIDADVYKAIRHDNIETIMNNIQAFITIKRNLKLKKPEIQVSAVDTRRSHKGLKRFVSYWLRYVDRVRIYPEHSDKGKFGSLKDAGFAKRYPCFKPLTECAICWNGDVGLCNHDWNHPLKLGNIYNASIADVWNSKEYNKVREAHYRVSFPGNIPCKYCDHWAMYYKPKKIVGSLFVRKKRKISDNDTFRHD